MCKAGKSTFLDSAAVYMRTRRIILPNSQENYMAGVGVDAAKNGSNKTVNFNIMIYIV